MKMILIISRVILSLILLYLIFLVWTKNVDLLIWTKNKIAKLLPINEGSTKGYTLDFEYDKINVLFFRSKNKTIDGKVAILFYNIAIVNRNEFSSTIKDFKATVEIGNRKQTLVLYNVKTGIVNTKKNVLAIADGKNKRYILMMNWENMHPKINKRKVLLTGEVLTGSLMFYVDRYFFDEELKTIKNIKLIITDFLGNKSVQNIKMDSKFEVLKENVFVIDDNFIQHENGLIEWENQ